MYIHTHIQPPAKLTKVFTKLPLYGEKRAPAGIIWFQRAMWNTDKYYLHH